MNNYGKDSFDLFEDKDKIRLITYKYFNQINSLIEKLKSLMENYSYIVIQTTIPHIIKTISKLNLLINKKVIYVFHLTNVYNSLHFSQIENKNRIWTLGHFPIGIYVNPHYFGKIKLKKKNKITRFFTISSIYRKYNYLVSTSQKLKEENYDFEIIVIGKTKTFSKKNINGKLKNNFIFNYNVNFSQLYKAVDSSDYILITLDPDNKRDKIFKYNKVTGSAQLSYGFLKPVIINYYFSNAYNMTKENCFLFDKTNFYEVMKKAIVLNNQDYKIMQKNLINLSNRLYHDSLLNVKKTLLSLK